MRDAVRGEPELLPCPFCGARAEVEYNNGMAWWEAVCEGATCHAGIIGEVTAADAIAAWNRRTPTPESEAS